MRSTVGYEPLSMEVAVEVLIHEACKFATDVFSLFLFLGIQFVCVLFVVLEKRI